MMCECTRFVHHCNHATNVLLLIKVKFPFKIIAIENGIGIRIWNKFPEKKNYKCATRHATCKKKLLSMTEITKYFRTESSNKTKFELVWPGVSPDNTGNIYNGLQLSPEIKKRVTHLPKSLQFFTVNHCNLWWLALMVNIPKCYQR